MEMCGKIFREAEIENEEYTDSDNPTHHLDFRATALLITIDKGKELEWSHNGGKDIHGRLRKGDNFIIFDQFDFSQIWFRSTNGKKLEYRMWAWERKK